LSLVLSFPGQAIEIQPQSVDIHVLGSRQQHLLGVVDVSLNGGRDYEAAGGGLIEMRFDDPNAVDRFLAMCIEISEPVSLGQRYRDYRYSALKNAPDSGVMGAGKAALLGELFDEIYPEFGGDIDGQPARPWNALALQVAVWEIVNEDGPTLDPYAGTVRFRNDRTFHGRRSLAGQSIAAADRWLKGLDGGTRIGPRLAAISKPGNQDLVVERPPQHQPIPSPDSLWLVAGMLAMAAAGRHRRHRS
jgi:hypothetical protein